MKHLLMVLPLLISSSPLWIQSAQSHDGHSAESLGVNVTELKKSNAMWNGSPLPNYPDGQPEITILRIKIPKGVRLPWHYHPVINAAVILQGALELETVHGNKKIYKKGEALIEVVNTIHSGKALGEEDVDLVVFYAGQNGVPTTVIDKSKPINK